MPPQTRNRFATQLHRDQERKRRVYLLDCDPLHSLQVLGAPQYLPKEIYGYNCFSTEDLFGHHNRVRTLIQSGRFKFGFDEDCVEQSLCFVYGVDVKEPDQNLPKKIRCLQIYYETPDTEDILPGMFGKEARSWEELSQWKEVLKSYTSSKNQLFQHAGGSSSAAAGGKQAGTDD